jgi:geranylgeranyl transferase type-2 subunit alpha
MQDLDLTLQALRQNPKNYSTWEHRKWLLKQLPEPQWKGELALVGKFLEADARNCKACVASRPVLTSDSVHGWNYRRHLITAAPECTSTSREFDFTTSKIMASFSNYSAWHYRSKLWPSRTCNVCWTKVGPFPGLPCSRHT